MDLFSGDQGAFHFRSSALRPELRSVRLTLRLLSTLTICVFFYIPLY